MRIAIDAMGGDHAPDPIVQGALQALAQDESVELILVGDQDRLEPLVDLAQPDRSRLSYAHTTEVVGMHESPVKAMRSKPNSSINVCWKLLAEDRVDGIISAGNTGAVVAGAVKTRRFLKNVQRVGIAVTLPTPTGYSVMLDVGANVHPKAEHLFEYGAMGMLFAKQLLGRSKPTIGLLNVGSEEGKGSELAKETQALFLGSHLRENFYGNIEGRDICRGVVDVIVCDGFVGNIALKCCEGMVDFLMTAVGNELLKTLNTEQGLAKQALHNLYNRYHYSEFGGAPLLGVDGVCLICHGSSDSRAIRNAVKAAKQYGPVNKLIVKELDSLLSEVHHLAAATV